MNYRRIMSVIKTHNGEKLRELNYELDFPSVQFSQTFNFSSLYKYAKSQAELWNKHENLPQNLQKSKDYFNKIVNGAENVIEAAENGEYLTNHISEFYDLVNRDKSKLFPADKSETIFLISLFNQDVANSEKLCDGAIAFFTNSVVYGSSRIDTAYLQGVTMGILFKTQTDATLNRSLHEKRSLNELRNRVEDYLSTAGKEIEGILTTGDAQVKGYLEDLSLEKSKNFSILKRYLKISQKATKIAASKAYEEKSNLERTYRELLQLQEPAQHWKKSSEKLLDEAHMFLRLLIALLIVGGFALYCLLWKTPQGMLAGFFNGDTVSAIRWSIVFVTFMSLIFIGIQVLRKAMFSSFHLARDAQEREKLTMYYLSLIKEGAVDDKDRNLILQSLFSRADSGLLKEDSSPTMPGSNIIDKVKL